MSLEQPEASAEQRVKFASFVFGIVFRQSLCAKYEKISPQNAITCQFMPSFHTAEPGVLQHRLPPRGYTRKPINPATGWTDLFLTGPRKNRGPRAGAKITA